MREIKIDSYCKPARDETGYTLVELLVVLIILGTVLGALSTAFVGGINSEARVTRRAQQEANARVALDRMRTDVRCASSRTDRLPPQPNASGGFTLTLTESPTLCPSVLNDTTQSGVQWCTIPYAGSTTRFQVFRETSGNCDGTGATLTVDYVAAPAAGWPQNTNTSPTPTSWDGNIWPTQETCVSGDQPTVAVDMNVNLDPDNHPEQGYELKDQIALRNAPVC